MENGMMDFEEFTGAVLEEIRQKADGAFEATVNTITKNNGVKLIGISASKEWNGNGPCVYLDSFYRDYKDGGIGLREAVDGVYALITKHLDDIEGVDLSGFMEWETVQGSIYAKLINAAQNQGQLEKVPHRMFLDMAVVYYMEVRNFEGEDVGTVLIHNSHMEMWGQDERCLYRKAMSNMRSGGKPSFERLETVLKNIQPIPGELLSDRDCSPDMGMYILTNCRRYCGASEILDNDTLQAIADKIGDNFVMLPSSIHECIVMRPKDGLEYGELADIVRNVNDTCVSVEERLSNHVYVYSKDEGVKIAV